jgi:uncharacterized cupredoxin-like copper-binding protein
MAQRIVARCAAGLLVAAVALSGCAGSGAPAQPGGGVAPKPAAAPAKAPGPYTPNGEADASAGRVALQMLDTLKFQPNTVTKVKAGATVTVELRNAGATLHSFLSPALGVAVPVKVNPGQTGTVTFTAPGAPGTYPFWCSEPGHAEAGKVGQVVVE